MSRCGDMKCHFQTGEMHELLTPVPPWRLFYVYARLLCIRVYLCVQTCGHDWICACKPLYTRYVHVCGYGVYLCVWVHMVTGGLAWIFFSLKIVFVYLRHSMKSILKNRSLGSGAYQLGCLVSEPRGSCLSLPSAGANKHMPP